MYTEAIIVAGITALATVVTQVIIAFRVNSLIAYRINELEKKVNRHNNLIERVFKVEERSESNTRRIDKLERGNG